MQRGRKQSPFIGRRVPLVDDGVPILYQRYTTVAEILIDGPGSKKRAAPENGHAEPQVEQQQQQQQPEQRQEQQPPAKKSKKEKKKLQQEQQQEQPQPEPELQQLAAAAIDPEAAALADRRALKAAKKEEKKKRKALEREQAATAAAAAGAASQQDADGTAGNTQQASDEGAAAGGDDKGNAAEAARIRGVLGFTAAAAAAAPAAAVKAAPPPSSNKFTFGFDNLSSLPPEERVAAETEAKLAAFAAVDSADNEGFVPRRVFVGGMPYSYSREQVAEYWSWCGPIESLDMLTFPDSGRFRGIAFITFEAQEGADAALACNGEEVDGQTLKVDRCKAVAAAKQMKAALTSSGKGASQQQQLFEGKPGPAPAPATPATAAGGGTGPSGGSSGPGKTPGYNVAYVGNIAFEAGPADISALFAECGVTKVRLHTDKASGKSKGYAHVHFADGEGLDKAIAMSGVELQGRCIKVSYGQPKKA